MVTHVAMITAVLCIAHAQALSISFDSEDAKLRPTVKVVRLLKGMQEQLQSESKEDAKIYDDFKCWCKKNLEDLAKSGKAAKRALKEKQLRAEELVSKIQRLKSEVEKLEDEMLATEANLKKQQVLRAHEAEEYADDKARLTEDLGGVTKAQTALTGGDATGFLQRSEAQASLAASLVQRVAEKHAQRFSNQDREALQAFVEDPAGGITSVSGILQGMQDDFAADLKQANVTEESQLKAFRELVKSLKDQMEAARLQIVDKSAEKIDAREESAHLKFEIKDIAASMGDGAGFEEEIKKQCAGMDEQFDKRTATRAEETEAISKAIETLNSEESHDLFSKSVPAFFLQQSAGSARRQLAAEVLGNARHLDTRLISLAMLAKIDKFTKVKKAMDDMITALKKEQEDETEQKEYCDNSFRENAIETGDKMHVKERQVAKEGTLNVKIDGLVEDISSTEKEIAELKTQLQQASQNREEENTEFQKIISEQRETQRLLKQALKVLGKFYNKQGSLAQVRAHTQQPKAPQGFKDYKANGQSFGVMTMLQQLISDSEIQVAEATKAEVNAQKAYEEFAKDSTVSEEAKQTEVADLRAAKATTKNDAVQTRQAREGTENELTALKATKVELHDSCDWLLANYDARQASRLEEMESVQKAKAVLSGATFAEIQLN